MSARSNTIGLGLIVAALLALGSTLLQSPRAAAQPAASGAGEMQRLAEAKIAIARRALGHNDDLAKLGRVEPSEYIQDKLQWLRRVRDAEIARAGDSAGKIRAAESYVGEAKELYQTAQNLVSAGRSFSPLARAEIEYEAADAESVVAELRSR